MKSVFTFFKGVISWLISFEEKKFASLWARSVMEKAQRFFCCHFLKYILVGLQNKS